ncbi:hypothetical protein GGS21DRAFT_325457 [Xylaria nigripes]|nr:hypothetical protein GGS21DRAFT_325457 [Xylaria nigripes]
MASDDGGNPSVFGYILLPVLGLGIVFCLLTCFRYRLRKQRAISARGATSSQPQAETNQGEPIVLVPGPSERRQIGLGLGLGLESVEEGLNEFGEAPPAYTAKPEAGSSRNPPVYGGEQGEEARSNEMPVAPPRAVLHSS